MNESNIITANIMFKHGIKVYFYPGMSHVKAAIYDGWLCTGSANFDKLSFKDNLELNVATSDPATVKALQESLFEKDFARSREMAGPLRSGLKERISEFWAEQL
jgi:phosphatidylserine/phosphatidylglycerophosphate/cardiolipin synthase-like enzyme